ncbi:MAG: hypothetical protein KDA51_20795, partial [Planctomycetales bacterium]|nr:hypothetical protein [Planctomycetales bacterium]
IASTSFARLGISSSQVLTAAIQSGSGLRPVAQPKQEGYRAISLANQYCRYCSTPATVALSTTQQLKESMASDESFLSHMSLAAAWTPLVV